MTKALAKPPTTITVAGLGITVTRAEIEAEHAADRETLAALAKAEPITDEEALITADASLTDVVRLKDELVARRQAAVKPTKALISEFESWFRAYIKDAEAAEKGLKGAIGAYRLKKASEAAKALETARVAADAGKSNEALAHVQASQALAAPDDARAGVRFVWEVKRVATDLLPDEWWAPDVARIAEVAKAAGSSEEPPVIPGVVFERVAIVAARR